MSVLVAVQESALVLEQVQVQVRRARESALVCLVPSHEQRLSLHGSCGLLQDVVRSQRRSRQPCEVQQDHPLLDRVRVSVQVSEPEPEPG